MGQSASKVIKPPGAPVVASYGVRDDALVGAANSAARSVPQSQGGPNRGIKGYFTDINGNKKWGNIGGAAATAGATGLGAWVLFDPAAGDKLGNVAGNVGNATGSVISGLLGGLAGPLLPILISGSSCFFVVCCLLMMMMMMQQPS